MSRSPVRKALTVIFGDAAGITTDSAMHVTMAAAAVSVSGVFLISPIVSDLTGPFAVSQARAGQIITAFTAPTIIFIPVMGLLADRVGRRPVLVGGLIVFGCAGTAVTLANRFETVLLLRLLQGVGHAAIMPVTVTLIGDLYERERETTAQGLRAASIQVVSLTTPVIAGVLILGSWRYPFLLYGLAFLLAAWAWVTFPTLQPAATQSIGEYIRMLLSAVSRPLIGFVVLTFFFRFVLTFSFFAYVSVLVSSEFGGSAIASGFVVSAFGIAALIMTSQAGRLVSQFEAKTSMIGGFALLGLGMVSMGYGASLPVVFASGLLLGMGGGITAPIQKSLVSQLSPESVRAGSVSAAYTFQGLGQTAGPFIMGLSLQIVDVKSAFVIFGIAGAIAGILAISVAATSGRLRLTS